MTEPATNSTLSKSRGQVIFEYILLALCLCALALRVTFTEGLNIQSASQPINLGSSLYSLSISAILFLSVGCWFVWAFCSKKFCYRFSGIEIGLCLFCVAAVAAGFAAANKRAAITEVACLIAPLLMAILLVQILDSQAKIKLVLAVIAALGVVSAYECANQLFVTNQAIINQYEQAPQTILEPLGIAGNSLQHWQFEHRLYSKDVRGFFTTGNSAGSFALLASFAAIALFLEKLKNRKSDSSSPRQILAVGIAVAVVLFGLAITHSKGVITASLIAAAIFITYLLFGNRLKAHRKAIFIVCLLGVLAAGYLVVSYGSTHGRLPGGNSMLVRWQYWHASAKMYADHLLTGVGPGNFAHFYPHYKPAEALETVADPHNFLLTILTQYGPLGLVGFLAMIFVPLWRVTSTSSADDIRHTTYDIREHEPAFKKLALVLTTAISVSLLLIRPIIMPITPGETLDVMLYVISKLYLAPVAAFIVGFLLLTANKKPDTQDAARNTNIIAIALCCAIFGSLVHNLIDFALFEPGVFTAFWAAVACLIAADFYQKARPRFILKPAAFVKAAAAIATLVITGVYFYYAWLPVYRSTAKIARTNIAAANGQFQQAHNLLAAAAEDDCLSPTALSLNGRLYLQRFYASDAKFILRSTTENGQADLLAGARDSLLQAINRNGADFKNFERLTKTYTCFAKISTQQAKSSWLKKAFDSANSAVERYPGSGRLHFELARITEPLGKTGIAIEHYKKAIEIENKYRQQFQLMYPGRELFSRLGEEKYQFAKERLKKLSNLNLSF